MCECGKKYVCENNMCRLKGKMLDGADLHSQEKPARCISCRHQLRRIYYEERG